MNKKGAKAIAINQKDLYLSNNMGSIFFTIIWEYTNARCPLEKSLEDVFTYEGLLLIAEETGFGGRKTVFNSKIL